MAALSPMRLSCKKECSSSGQTLHSWRHVLPHDGLLLAEADAEALKETQNDMEAKGDAELKQAANSSRHTSVMPATPGVAAPSVVAKGVPFSLSLVVIWDYSWPSGPVDMPSALMCAKPQHTLCMQQPPRELKRRPRQQWRMLTGRWQSWRR